jgi:hypothetical protein
MRFDKLASNDVQMDCFRFPGTCIFELYNDKIRNGVWVNFNAILSAVERIKNRFPGLVTDEQPSSLNIR